MDVKLTPKNVGHLSDSIAKSVEMGRNSIPLLVAYNMGQADRDGLSKLK